MKTSRAFTLLEILVVIALMASLMALLFPVFSQAREKARQSVCTANLRQIGQAMAMYAQDYDGLYPFGADPLDKKTFHYTGVDPDKNATLLAMPYLHDLLFTYTKSHEIWRCPSDTGFHSLPDWPDHATGEPITLEAQPSAFDAFGTSYTYNSELAFRHKLFATDGWTSGHSVGPEKIMVLSDLTGPWHATGSGFNEFVYITLLGDGHASRLTSTQYIDAIAVQLDKP